MNLYWPVYQNIENEVIELSKVIHFSDDQLCVYSVRMADLIVRCVVEIEALSKELYKKLGGNMEPTDINGKKRDLYFDTDCFALINQKWNLDKKVVTIISPTMYFEKNKRLIPLHKSQKRGRSGAKWNKAYQALKHDRYSSLKKHGTIDNLLYALGALYILNIYYADDNFDVGYAGYGSLNFKSQYFSSIFEPEKIRAYNFKWKKKADDSCIVWDNNASLDSAIYVIKYSNQDFLNQHFNWCVDERDKKVRFEQNALIKDYLKEHPDEKNNDIDTIAIAAGGKNLLDSIKYDTAFFYNNRYPKVEEIIYKGEPIYPVSEYNNKTLDDEIFNRMVQIVTIKNGLKN